MTSWKTLLSSVAFGSLTGLAPGVAWSVDLPVVYRVDAQALKADAPAGTMLTFELHSDALCSSAYFSDTLDVANVAIQIDSLKAFKVKGGTKPPKVARLERTITGVASGPAYLKVSGSGITAVGGSCQAQASGIEGAEGPAGTPTEVVSQVFGIAPLVFFSTPEWVLDGPSSGSVRLTKVTSGFISYRISGATTVESFFSADAQTTTVAFSASQSAVIEIDIIDDATSMHTIRCMKRTSNEIVCKKW